MMPYTGRRLLLGLLAALTLFGWSLQTAVADPSPPPPDVFSTDTSTDGLKVTVGDSRDSVTGLAKSPTDDGKSPVQTVEEGPRYEYGSTTACTGNPPGGPATDALCTMAITACADPAKGAGPLTRIWRRTVVAGQPPSPWTQVGLTCWADAVPGSRPGVTMAMIQQAFHTTPWANPVISTEPKGNVTLVSLDTYYKVNWAARGFQPDEVEPIDPATMLGFQVEIRPRLDHFTYVFGDGQDFGPTSNEGGVYPSGGITHQYLKAGDYPARVDTTFGADFRINGGAWAPIPDTVTVPGPATNVTVKTARAQLVNH